MIYDGFFVILVISTEAIAEWRNLMFRICSEDFTIIYNRH
jgi:hypothetical protein